MNPQRDDFGDAQGDSNPFSADLNSAFNSSVSQGATQLFRDGGFQGDKRNKIILGALLVVALAAFAYMYYPDSSEDHSLVVTDQEGKEDDDFADTDDIAGKKDVAAKKALPTEIPTVGETKPLGKAPSKSPSIVEEPIHEDIHNDVRPAPAGKLTTGMSIEDYQMNRPAPRRVTRAHNPPTLKSPNDGTKISYDETTSFAELNWDGPATWLLLSRQPNMQPVAEKYRVHGHSFRLINPYPGRWYWQVTNSAGASRTGNFYVTAPSRRAVALTNLKEGDSLAGNGGTVHWTGDTKVSYYRVELSQAEWVNPPYRFASSGTQLNINGVPAGAYKLRIGAFSENSGRWEYTQPINVTVH